MKTKNVILKNFLSVPYFVINIFILLFLTAVFIYFSLFSAQKNNYPLQSSLEIIHAGKEISTGLSHSFSEIIRGNLRSAKEHNVYGLNIFLFFALQLIMRILFTLLFHFTNRPKNIIFADVTISLILFMILFYPFIQRLIVLILE